jgi:hypothetical protein
LPAPFSPSSLGKRSPTGVKRSIIIRSGDITDPIRVHGINMIQNIRFQQMHLETPRIEPSVSQQPKLKKSHISSQLQK